MCRNKNELWIKQMHSIKIDVVRVKECKNSMEDIVQNTQILSLPQNQI